MIVLDTDTLTLLLAEHPRVVDRYRRETDEVAIAIITRIEVLLGRFATLMKAADGAQLQRGQQRFDRAERDLKAFRSVPISDAGAAEFDRLRRNKKVRKIGRGDLLIAAIVMRYSVRLASRNQRDFRQVPGLQVENWAD